MQKRASENPPNFYAPKRGWKVIGGIESKHYKLINLIKSEFWGFIWFIITHNGTKWIIDPGDILLINFIKFVGFQFENYLSWCSIITNFDLDPTKFRIQNFTSIWLGFYLFMVYLRFVYKIPSMKWSLKL